MGETIKILSLDIKNKEILPFKLSYKTWQKSSI